MPSDQRTIAPGASTLAAPNRWLGDRTEMPGDPQTGVDLPLERYAHARRVLLTGWMKRDLFDSWCCSWSALPTPVHPTVADHRWRQAMRDSIPEDIGRMDDGGEQLVVEVSIRVRRSRSV